MDYNYETLPLKAPLDDYLEYGHPVGGFLQAVLSNQLFEAVGRADLENRARLAEYVSYLYNHAPMYCRGSEERVREWIHKGGKAGRRRLEDMKTRLAHARVYVGEQRDSKGGLTWMWVHPKSMKATSVHSSEDECVQEAWNYAVENGLIIEDS